MDNKNKDEIKDKNIDVDKNENIDKDTNKENNKVELISHEECGCTKEDFADALVYLPTKEIEEILEKGFVEGECANCGTKYKIEENELEEILKNNEFSALGCNLSCSGCPSDCSMDCE